MNITRENIFRLMWVNIRKLPQTTIDKKLVLLLVHVNYVGNCFHTMKNNYGLREILMSKLISHLLFLTQHLLFNIVNNYSFYQFSNIIFIL